MTFLNPAVLFGLFAASIPIVIHLLNLRRLKKIEFSTLAFLKELQKNQIRRVKLKQWILLLLRILIILLLVTAFARPTLQGVAVSGASSAVKTTAVFILDDTYSMSLIDEQGSYFNQARALLQKHLAALQPGDDAVIIPVSSAQPNVSGTNAALNLTKNMKELARQAKEIRIGEASGTLHEAVIHAAAALGGSRNYNKELYIFTDLQKNRITRDSLHSDLGEYLSQRVNIYLFPFEGKEAYNLAIDSATINSAILHVDRPLSVSVFVRNTSPGRGGNTVVSLFLNGERTAQKAVKLNGGDAAEVGLESTIKKSGFNEIVVALEDDDIAADNKYYAALDVPEKIPIAIFEQAPGDGAFIRLALRTDDSLALFTPEIKPLAQFNQVNPDKYKMVFLAGVSKNTQWDRLKSFASAGGGVFIAPGSSTAAADFASLLSALDFPPAVSLMEQQAGKTNAAAFANPDFGHPLLRGIFAQNEKQKIESPDFYKAFLFQPGGTGRTIIALNTQSAYLAETRINKGRILLAASAFLPSWTNFPFKAFFVPFLYRSVFYLTGSEFVVPPQRVGEPLRIEAKKFAGKLIKIGKLGGQTETLQEAAGQEYYRNTFSAGNYRFFAGEKLIDIVPVNHDPEESKTEYASAGDFEDYLKKVNAKAKLTVIKDAGQSLDVVKRARFGAELWKWFAIAALIAALIEMWVAKSSKKEMPSG